MSIAKNTAYITSAFVIQKVIAFFYIAIIARNINPELLGKYFLALSFTTIFSIFIDAGLTPVLTREVAKYADKATKYFNNILSLKLIFALFTFLAIFITTNLLGEDDFTKKLIYIASGVMFLDSLTLTFYALLRSHQILKFEAVGIVAYQILTITIGGIVVITTQSVALLITVLMFSSFLNAIYSFLMARRISRIKFKFTIDKKFIKYAMVIASPFFLAGIFNRIYTNIDIILISRIAGDSYSGWYGIANKFVFALQFIPSAFVASIYPAMSKYYEHSKEKLQTTFERSMIYLMVISIPICFGAIALSDKIILGVYKEQYINSIMPLNLLSIALIFVFLYFPVGSLLNASNRQKINTANMGIAMIINVILNLILIPKINMAGAAIASIVSQVIMLMLGLYEANKVIAYDKKLLLIRFMQNIITASLMLGAILLLKDMINWIIILPLAVVFYFSFLFIIGGFSRADFQSILTSVGIRK